MTVRTITTWTSFPSPELQQELGFKIQESTADGTLLEFATTPNSGGFKNNVAPMLAIRIWATAADAQAWVDYLATNIPDGNTTEIIV